MPSGTLTRAELKEELQAFAHGLLADTLRQALRGQDDAIASKFHESMDAGGGFGRTLSGTPTRRGKRGPSQYYPVPVSGVRVLAQERTSKKDFLQPALKYEAQVAARQSSNEKQATLTTDSETARKSLSRDLALLANESHSGHPYSTLPANSRESTMGEDGTATNVGTTGCRSKLRALVESARFEQCSGLFVALNSISLGYDVNYMATHPEGETSIVTTITEMAFCVLFTVELFLRIGAFGCEFFTMDGWRWNYFDIVVVSVQVLEHTMVFVSQTEGRGMNLTILRMLRFLRVVRFARLFRAFHLFDDLRVIVSSIGSSISSLAWSMLLLLILIYVFSLLFLQSVASAGHTEHYDELQFYFSSLFRTILTMFECIVGGVNWDLIVWPIAADISPILAIAFCVYISASLFAMMNILTGIFVDKAMSSVREDKDVVLARRVRDLFLAKDGADNEAIGQEITWDVFEQKLDQQAMQDYFAQINVEISGARSLFDLMCYTMDANGSTSSQMDVHESTSLNAEEIVRACLQLRGPARALDLSSLARDVHDIHRHLCEVEGRIMQFLQK